MRGRTIAVISGVLAVALLTLSIFTSPGPMYFVDSVNHYYLVQRYHGGGSPLHYTLNSSVTGSFYPNYAMYGGSLYAVTAAIGTVTGSDWFAYGLTYLLAFALAFGGLFWLARLLGLRAYTAVGVALIYVSSAYYLSNPYGRGAWPEFIATSAFPLVLAALVSVLRSDHPSRKSVAVLILATVAWSGSHLISVVFGTLFVIAAVVVMTLSSPSPRWWPRRTNVVLALASVGSAFAINAWFLLPQAIYAHSTLVSSQVSTIYAAQLTHLQTLLSPFPAVSSASTVPHLYTNLPMLPLLWALAVLFVSGARKSAGRLAWLTAVVLAGYVALLASHRTWALVPRFLYVIQFPYRLLTYATLIVCALAVLACRSLRSMSSKERHRWLLAGAVVITCQVGFAAFQIVSSRGTLDEMHADIHQMERDGAPPHFYAPRDYRFIPDHPVDGTTPTVFATTLQSDRTAHLVDAPPPGSRVVVDVPDSPFVEVRGGGRRVGATTEGLMVVEILSPEVVIGRAMPLPARIGQWLTVVGLVAAALLVSLAPRSRRRSRK